MHGRLLAPLLLLLLGLHASSEGAADVACLAFTQAAAASDAVDADKDARVQADAKLGAGWRAATVLDVAVHFDPARHDASVRFSVAGSPYVWKLTPLVAADGGATDLLVLGPEPPPPPGGVWPLASIAAIRDDAPIAFTRGRIQPDAADGEKDELAVAELGALYGAASLDRLREAFRRVLTPGTEKLASNGSAEAFGLRLKDGQIVLEVSRQSAKEREGAGVPLAAQR